MHKFNDSEQREWSLSLNGWQLKKLKERLDFDARDHQSILNAANDPILLVNVLFVLCEDQAKAANVSDEGFGKAMDGDAIDAATNAYIEESADFFPSRQRPALKAMLAKMKDYQEKAASLATEKVTSGQIDQVMQKALSDADENWNRLLAGTNIGNSSGNTQA